MDTMTFEESYKYNHQRGYNGWYDECSCCPYGYHIDLDFVRYCESIGKESDRSGPVKRRKDRRKHRQSMEVMLGITQPIVNQIEFPNYETIVEQERPKIIANVPRENNTIMHQSSFDDAVTDFENTLQRSKNKHYNLPDVTAVSEMQRMPSNSSLSSVSSLTVHGEATNNKDFDTVSIESNLSPLALQNIREQMAIGLERTKQLEDQVKLIPQLKEQLSKLKEENRKLHLKANATEFAINPTVRNKSQSITNIDSLDSLRSSTPPRKDFGVTCAALTRTIGVGNRQPNQRTVATATTVIVSTADKWLGDKVNFMSTQTDQSSQRAAFRCTNNATQTQPEVKLVRSRGCTASPTSQDVGVQKSVPSTKSIATGPESREEESRCPVSLLLLNSKSRSFHLGEERLNHVRKRTVACQSEATTVLSRACQYEFRVEQHAKSSQCQVEQITKAIQHETDSADKTTQSDVQEPILIQQVEGSPQKIFCNKLTDTSELTSVIRIGNYDIITASKQTDTSDLQYHIRHYDITTASKQTDTKDLPVAVPKKNDAKLRNNSKGTDTKDFLARHSATKVTDTKDLIEWERERREEGASPSRIPRLQPNFEYRKFRRQDTYTKVYDQCDRSSSSSSIFGLSGLDLSPKSESDHQIVTSLEKVKQNLSLPDISQNDRKNTVECTPLPQLETPSTQNPRIKVVPSREMQGAMKVLHDSLQKSQTKNPKAHNAISIIQKEWFNISSTVTANPLDVEDYLDAFEEVSSLFLEYVVNLTDDSGNTAMHYAVSHGNFDVVSILLDSKVCDINKSNKAGYTSVMLVSLAEVRSDTHASVTKRLLQLSDVNIRAKQHGQTALMLAVSHGRLDMVTMLIEAGADINIQDDDGSTALMCAAEHGHVDIVKHFLSQPDCDSSITDIDGSTALKIAMEAGHRHIGVLLYAHQKSSPSAHGSRRRSKPSSPKAPSSPLPIRSSHRALTDTKTTK